MFQAAGKVIVFWYIYISMLLYMKLREHTFYVCIFMVKCLIVFAYREVMRQYRSEKVKYLTQSYSKI